MSEADPREPDPAVLEANLTATAQWCPRTAEVLRIARPPAEARPALGRDGSPTFCWRDRAGEVHWLGRTTMPAVRAGALIDAFQHGSRNALICGLQQGEEARLLLTRMARHQAVFVVDETAWAATLGLRLHDFAEDLRRGRLLVFSGERAWEELQAFLIEHPGYLPPERVLSWPWFDATAIASVTERLSAIGAAVAAHRGSRIAEARRLRAADPAANLKEHGISVAVISNVPEPRVLRTAEEMRAAAGIRNVACRTFVLDGPSMVHPYAMEAAVWLARPSHEILLDIMPKSLPFDLPPGAVFAMVTHGQPLNSAWLNQLPATARLAVRTREQREQAVGQGVEPSRVIVLPPAATPGLTARLARPGRRAVVVAEGADVSAGGVGLHLTSHCHLWEAAARLIEKRCDSYRDDEAENVLEAAERSLRIRIDSDTVRSGLLSRIRNVLGPVLVRRAYCTALADAHIDFDLYGGWQSDPILAKYDRGAWPQPGGVAEALDGRALMIVPDTSGRLRPELLDALAAGLPGLVRRHPLDTTPDGLAAVLEPETHVTRFDTRATMVNLVSTLLAGRGDFADRAARAAEHVARHHTWASRLETIMAAGQAG